MKLKNTILITFHFFATCIFAQNSFTSIETSDGVHYITPNIDYPITGTYYFEGAEPIVELNAFGTGIYQLHDQPKREMVWGIECDENGAPKFIKGFDSAAYTLWYQYTTSTENDAFEGWKQVPFTIHFNTLKMYIQGERMKDYSETSEILETPETPITPEK